MADDEEVGDAGAPRDRGGYLSQAYITAFGKYDEPDWDPGQGFAANRDRLIKVYDYYRDIYLKRPDEFLWAGTRSPGRRRCRRNHANRKIQRRGVQNYG